MPGGGIVSHVQEGDFPVRTSPSAAFARVALAESGRVVRATNPGSIPSSDGSAPVPVFSTSGQQPGDDGSQDAHADVDGETEHVVVAEDVDVTRAKIATNATPNAA